MLRLLAYGIDYYIDISPNNWLITLIEWRFYGLKFCRMARESENKKRPHRRAYCADKTRRLFVFFVAQRDDQHVDMNGVNQLAGRGHQLAPEVLMMAADHQVHIVFFNRIDQHLAKVAAAAQGLGDGIACVGRKARSARDGSLRRCVFACRRG